MFKCHGCGITTRPREEPKRLVVDYYDAIYPPEQKSNKWGKPVGKPPREGHGTLINSEGLFCGECVKKHEPKKLGTKIMEMKKNYPDLRDTSIYETVVVWKIKKEGELDVKYSSN